MSNTTQLEKTLQKLSSVIIRAYNNKTFEFISLAHLLNVEFLKDCYHNLARNKTVGVAKVSWKEYKEDLDNNL